MIRVYGKQKSGDSASESAEMITFFNKLRAEYPELSMLATHIKNEGKRKFSQVQHDKASGLVKGFADIIIVGSPTFVCEMKSKSKSSKLSDHQKKFLENSDKSGAFTCIAYGYEGAIEAVKDWYASRR